ncbi:MAG: hypothetical protein HFE49_10515 [Clostridia bacterium]|nr:hypothetical protein [Clostridia bacterium]
MIDKKEEAKIVNGVIKLTDWQKLHNVYRGLARMSTVPNWATIPHHQMEITTVQNDLIHISQIVATE